MRFLLFIEFLAKIKLQKLFWPINKHLNLYINYVIIS